MVYRWFDYKCTTIKFNGIRDSVGFAVRNGKRSSAGSVCPWLLKWYMVCVEECCIAVIKQDNIQVLTLLYW